MARTRRGGSGGCRFRRGRLVLLALALSSTGFRMVNIHDVVVILLGLHGVRAGSSVHERGGGGGDGGRGNKTAAADSNETELAKAGEVGIRGVGVACPKGQAPN